MNNEINLEDNLEPNKQKDLNSDLNLTDDSAGLSKGLSNIRGFNVEVSAEVGVATIELAEAEKLTAGSIVMLAKIEGELTDVKINGNYIGKGQIIESDGRYGVKIVSLNSK